MRYRTDSSWASVRRGVTFVHVLVLTAIIALVIAILIPQVQRLREQANLVICKDNLRRIGSDLILYARANGGELPVSPTVENPHLELIHCLTAGGFIGDPAGFTAPAKAGPVCNSVRRIFSPALLAITITAH